MRDYTHCEIWQEEENKKVKGGEGVIRDRESERGRRGHKESEKE